MENDMICCLKQTSSKPVISIIMAASLFVGVPSSTGAGTVLMPITQEAYKCSQDELCLIKFEKNGMKKEITGYNSIEGSIKEGAIMGLNTQSENLEILDEIGALEYNWDDNEAQPIRSELVSKMKGLILRLPVQPEIFPTARPSIQFEYGKENGEYLEFELLDNLQIKIYKSNLLKERSTRIIDFNADEVVKVVKEFYE